VSGFAVSPNFVLSIALLAATGFCMILSTATANSLLQALVPNALRGRVMSVYVVMFLGITPIGYLQAGAVAGILGARMAIVIGAAAQLFVLTATIWQSRELRELI
jgi:hypothetical protein